MSYIIRQVDPPRWWYKDTREGNPVFVKNSNKAALLPLDQARQVCGHLIMLTGKQHEVTEFTK